MGLKGILLIISGLVCLVGVFIIVRGIRKKNRCTEPGVATIVDIKRKEDTNDKGKTKYSYRPVLEFNVGTQTYKKAAGVKSENRKAYKVGDKVNIKFNPLKPKEFMTTKQKTGVVTGGLVIAASAALAGVTLWIAK